MGNLGNLDIFMGIVALGGVVVLTVDAFAAFLPDGGTAEMVITAATGGAAAYLGARMVF